MKLDTSVYVVLATSSRLMTVYLSVTSVVSMVTAQPPSPAPVHLATLARTVVTRRCAHLAPGPILSVINSVTVYMGASAVR